MYSIYLVLAFLVVATSATTTTNSAIGLDMIMGLVKVESPLGIGFANLSLSLDNQQCLNDDDPNWIIRWKTVHCITDEDGSCKLSFLSGCPFEIKGKELLNPSSNTSMEPGFDKKLMNDSESEPPTFSIIGIAPTTSNFKYTTYLGTMEEMMLIYKRLGITYDAKAGVAVVGIDFSTDGSNDPSTLQPAVGASVTLSYAANHSVVTSSTPFYYKYQVSPQFGNEIMPHSSSFLTFPNIPAVDELIVTVDPGDSWKQCYISPGNSANVRQIQFTATAETISIIAFICE